MYVQVRTYIHIRTSSVLVYYCILRHIAVQMAYTRPHHTMEQMSYHTVERIKYKEYTYYGMIKCKLKQYDSWLRL